MPAAGRQVEPSSITRTHVHVKHMETTDPLPEPHVPDVAADAKKTVAVLREVSSTSQSLNEVVSRMREKVADGEMATASGLSFLELRNLMMLTYLMDIVSVAEKKCSGVSLEQEECKELILRIAEMRTSIEKMRPIHLKLKYRIEKLIRAATTQSIDPSDPINLRPNIQALDIEEEDAGDKNATDKKTASDFSAEKKYVVPKVSAVHYDDDTPDAKKSKALERAKKRALSSNLMSELRGEFDDAPEEISEMTVGRKKQQKQLKERIRYEEENFTRLNVQKQKKRKEDALLTIGDLGSTITKFDDVSALDQTLDDMNLSGKQKKKRMSVKSGKKKSGAKRKFKRRK